MLELRELNDQDIEKEYLYIRDLPENENGFTNPYFGVTHQQFIQEVYPKLKDYAKGHNLPKGFVPSTEYFLWDDDKIVGLFRIRHELNDALRNGSGHIGYGIAKEYRNRGYATKGLKLTIEKAWKIIKEDEIYMSVRKENDYSLQVQIKNGAYVHHEDEDHYYTRIKRY